MLIAQLLTVIGQIPGLQWVWPVEAIGKGLQVLELALRQRFGAGHQIMQKRFDVGHAIGHAARQLLIGVVGKPQSLRLLLSQRQDLIDNRAVVMLPGQWAPIGGAGVPGAIKTLAQGAVVGIGDDGAESRKTEVGPPPRFASLLGQLRQLCQGIVWQAGQLSRFIKGLDIGLTGIEHMVTKLGAQLRQAQLIGLKCLANGAFQINTGELEVFDGQGHRALHGGRVA